MIGQPAAHSPLRRITEIDGLRAYAVGIVVLSHFFVAVIPGGGVGVDVFFVISGFVITRGLLKDYEASGRIDIKAFYRRRIWRLWPALWAVTACITFASAFIGQFRWQAALTTILSIMNWSRAYDLAWLSPLDHTWSLSIEEQFYVIWPICFIVLMKIKTYRTPVMIAAIICAIAWRYHLDETGASVNRIYNGLDSRSDGLLLGCAAAISGIALPKMLSNMWPVPVAWLAYITVIDRSGSWSYTITSLASAWLVLASLRQPHFLTKLLNNKVAQWGGSRSYSMYLWHFPLLYILERLSLSRGIEGFAYFFGTIIVTELSYQMVEQKFRHGWLFLRLPRLARTGA